MRAFFSHFAIFEILLLADIDRESVLKYEMQTFN